MAFRPRVRLAIGFLSALLLVTQGVYGPAPAAATSPSPIRYTYDAAGRLSGVIDPAAGSAGYNYDATGNTTSITRNAATTVVILEFAPDAGPVGATVSIDGTGFSTTPSQNAVKFNGVAAPIVSSTATEVVATVPSGATTGTISITTPSGGATSSTSFTVGSTAPTITGFSPAIGPPGTTLTVSGTNFEPNTGSNAVRLNSLFAKVTSATTTSLSVTTPTTTSGRVTVGTPAGTASSPSYFFVPPPSRTAADIDDTKSVAVGSTVTVGVSHAGNDALIAFDGTGNQRVNMIFSNVTLSSEASVLAPDGTTLRGFQDTASGTFFDSFYLPVTGTYELWVDGYPGATGSLSVQVTTVPPDATATATIDGPAASVTTTVAGQNAKVLRRHGQPGRAGCSAT